MKGSLKGLLFSQQGYLSKLGAKSFRVFQVPYLLDDVFHFFHLYSAPGGRASPGSVGCSLKLLETGPGRNLPPAGLITHFKTVFSSGPGDFCIFSQIDSEKVKHLYQ